MDRDRVLYHFSEEGDITYCSGEGQALALRGLAILPWRGTGFSLPGPTGKWKLSPDVLTDETAAPIHRAPSQQ